MQLDEFIDLKGYFSLLDHEPGKMQLRLDPRVLMHPSARILPSLFAGNPQTGLISAKANPLASTLVFEYDTQKMEPAVLEEFIVTDDSAKARELAKPVAHLLGIELDAA